MRIIPFHTKCWLPWSGCLLFGLFTLLGIINLFNLHSRQTIYTQQYKYSLALKQAIQVKNLFNAVSTVQEQLSDISATLGLDHLDQGFNRAKNAVAEFHNELENLRQLMSRQSSRPDVKLDLTALAEQFDRFYALGIDMTTAYIHHGTLQGNQKMKPFDAQADHLRETLAELITTLEQQMTHWQQAIKQEPNDLAAFSAWPNEWWLYLMGSKTRTHYIQFMTHLTQVAPQQDQRMELSLKAQKLRGLVIHVKQWLTDLSATRGRDGLDEGATHARQGTDDFLAELPDFQTDVRQTNNQEWIQKTEHLDEQFKTFYAKGEAMATAYRQHGTKLGNPLMLEFDTMADELEQILLVFITPSIQDVFAGDYQMDLVVHSIQTIRKALVFLLCLSLLLSAICYAWLVSCVRTC